MKILVASNQPNRKRTKFVLSHVLLQFYSVHFIAVFNESFSSG